MNAVWLAEGCVADGTHYPEKLAGSNKAALDHLSVQYVIEANFITIC